MLISDQNLTISIMDVFEILTNKNSALWTSAKPVFEMVNIHRLILCGASRSC